ncbi:MAG: hypothetical protein ABSH46_20460 [Bryobacteraceae bacterium]|jgi:hypothetical protein
MFGAIAAVSAMQTRTAWGTQTVELTPQATVAFALLAVLGVAWLMVRKSRGIPVWSLVLVALCGLSLVGRARLLFGDDSDIPGFAMIFVALGALVDIAAAVVAIGTFKEWWRRRHPIAQYAQ